MATLINIHRPRQEHISSIHKRDAFIEKLIPRRCMIVSVGLILAGLSIPALMAFQVLLVTFPLCFLGFALTLTGGIMALIFCGGIG